MKQFFESTYHNLQHKKGLDLAATSLFSLRKADRAIEDFVEDFCGLCIQVDFNDAALKDFFSFWLKLTYVSFHASTYPSRDSCSVY